MASLPASILRTMALRVLVPGGRGMLGTDVVAEATKRGHEAISLSRPDFDIADPLSAARIAAEEFGRIDACINCAAYTAVDLAEDEEREATEANGIGPGYLARACAALGIRFLHVSTDFVFDGSAAEPYTEEASTRPLSAYGRSKLLGEREVLAAHQNAWVFRTAWLFGPHGKSFPRTMINARRAGKSLRVVADQTGNPTYTPDLARVLLDAVEFNIFPGIYHATGPDTMTWFEFAKQAVATDLGGGEPNIAPIRTEDWPTKATRPRYSVLSNEKLRAAGIAPMRPIREALKDFLRDGEGA